MVKKLSIPLLIIVSLLAIGGKAYVDYVYFPDQHTGIIGIETVTEYPDQH